MRSPAIPRLFGLSVVARTPEAVLSLLFILQARRLGGSYAIAGLSAAAIGAGLALGAPVLGRLIDRCGQTLVLLATATIAAIMIVAAAALPDRTPAVLLIVVAFIAGLSTPPVASCLRALLVALSTPELRHRLLALDAAMQEVAFTLGPLIFISALSSISVSAALIAAAACLWLGTVAFARSNESRSITGDRRSRPRAGALSSVAVRALVLIAVGIGAMYGATEVGIAAVAAHHGGASTLGALIIVWSVPSLAAGLLLTRLGVRTNTKATLIALLAAATVLTAALAAARGTVLTVVFLGASGMIAAPLFASVSAIIADAAPAGCLTEANTWIVSGGFIGVAAGNAIGGTLISADGVATAFIGAASAAGAAALVAILARHALSEPHTGSAASARPLLDIGLADSKSLARVPATPSH